MSDYERLESLIQSLSDKLEQVIENKCFVYDDKVVSRDRILDVLDEYDLDRLKELLEIEGYSLALKEDGNVDFQKIDNQELVSVLLDHGIIELATISDYLYEYRDWQDNCNIDYRTDFSFRFDGADIPLNLDGNSAKFFIQVRRGYTSCSDKARIIGTLRNQKTEKRLTLEVANELCFFCEEQYQQRMNERSSRAFLDHR